MPTNDRMRTSFLADPPSFGGRHSEDGPSIDDLCNEIKSLQSQLMARDQGFARKQMQCGHPVACIVIKARTELRATTYCGWCASLDKARDTERARWEPVEQTINALVDKLTRMNQRKGHAFALDAAIAYGSEVNDLLDALVEATK